MLDNSIYEDIALRSGGNVYLGVVGPVRTGKSTLIKRIITELILANVEDMSLRTELTDELPQSAGGKTVMTTEPKFLPAKAVKVRIENAEANFRLIDCVGFPIDGANGFEEDGEPRLVKTMWDDSPMPFKDAAILGTQKVIRDHSTIGICVTCDGSVTGISRAEYVEAEERTVYELKKIGKPFVIVLNCAEPNSKSATSLVKELNAKYSAPVVAANCETASKADIMGILKAVLFEFPLCSFNVNVPEWVRALPPESSAVSELISKIKVVSKSIKKMSDCESFNDMLGDCRFWDSNVTVDMSLSNGTAEVSVQVKDGVFFQMLSEASGEDITDETSLISFVSQSATAKRSYDKIKDALECAKVTGYGIVEPDDEDMDLEKPKVVRQGSNVGIKLRASAPSYHIVKVNVFGEVSPIMGLASQSEDMVNGIMNGFETDPQGTWDMNLFGKSLKGMVKDGLAGKVNCMQEDTRNKMRRTITRIVNESKGGVICILL